MTKEPRLEPKEELTKIIQDSEMYDLAWKYCDLNDDGHDDWARKLADAILDAGFTKSNRVPLDEEKVFQYYLSELKLPLDSKGMLEEAIRARAKNFCQQFGMTKNGDKGEDK